MTHMGHVAAIALVVMSSAVHADTETSGPAKASWVRYRAQISGGAGYPLDDDMALGVFSFHVGPQSGIAWLEDGKGHGPFLTAGAHLGLGLYTDVGNAGGCEDEVDEQGDSRWTCGRLHFGPYLGTGWSWGRLATTGYALPEYTFSLKVLPYAAVGKDQDGSFAEMGGEVRAGFHGFFGFDLYYSVSPKDRYVGLAMTINAAFSTFGEKDQIATAGEDTPPASEPPVERAYGSLRLEVGGGLVGPIARGDDNSAEAFAHLALYGVRGSELAQGEVPPTRASWLAIGGALSLVRPTVRMASRDSSVDFGPSVLVGYSTLADRSASFSVYGRATPVIGWRVKNDDSQFDYGIRGGVGVAFGMPASLDDDDPMRHQTGPFGLGVELTAALLREAMFLGASMMLVIW